MTESQSQDEFGRRKYCFSAARAHFPGPGWPFCDRHHLHLLPTQRLGRLGIVSQIGDTVLLGRPHWFKFSLCGWLVWMFVLTYRLMIARIVRHMFHWSAVLKKYEYYTWIFPVYLKDTFVENLDFDTWQKLCRWPAVSCRLTFDTTTIARFGSNVAPTNQSHIGFWFWNTPKRWNASYNNRRHCASS